MNQLTPPRRRGAGRPTREEAERRHEELLDRALELFLEKGYELATIEAIAASAQMTKRTVYARYEDKRALFKAAVRRAVDRWYIPAEELRALECDDLEATLTAVGRTRLAANISPEGLRLQQIINAEAYRFPDIFTLAYELGSRPLVEFLADLLRRHMAAGEIRVEDPWIAATAFLSMVVGGPARGIWWGGPVDRQALEARIGVCVRLFLNGARRRDA